MIKAAIVLNICVCGCLMIPVSIEPSEILKRKKKLEKQIKSKEIDATENIQLQEESGEKQENLDFSSNQVKITSKEDALFRSYSSLNYIDSMQSINKNQKNQEFKNKNNNSNKKCEKKEEESKMFDPKILLNILFLLFAISNFLTSLGFNAPYIYITVQAIRFGISELKADILLQIIGISNMVGRIVLGCR